MIILDSNIWIAYLNLNDINHSKAEKIFEKINNQTITITEYIIIEVSTILLYKNSKKSANLFLKYIFDNQNIEILNSNFDLFLKFKKFFIKSKNKKLSFVDSSLLCLSSKNFQIKTFDQALRKAILKSKLI